jgi:Bacterial Ig-like domain/L,D-transpeptidase catalytic domain
VLRKVSDHDEEARRSHGRGFKTGLVGALVAAVALVAGIVVATTSGSPAPSAASHGKAPATGRPVVPLRVTSVTPAPRSSDVAGSATIAVSFSTPVAASSGLPTFSPAVAGTWQASGRTLVFSPATPLAPATKYELRLPAGQAGLRSSSGGLMAHGMTDVFRTAPYSQMRLGQLLSQLGYLPLSWKPIEDYRLTGAQPETGMIGQEEMAYSAPAGSFTWQSGYPAELRSQWVAGQPNVLLRGAVMAFQAQHNMEINGALTPKLWHALFVAADNNRFNGAGYTYAVASKGSPETLTIWHDGRVVLRSLANTGIPVAPTVDGTFPVYLRFLHTIMSGTNPDGSHYSDPVSYVSYFNGGDAVHYFPRGAYGFQQSLGCVELPYTQAQRAYPFLTYGSLVSVIS